MLTVDVRTGAGARGRTVAASGGSGLSRASRNPTGPMQPLRPRLTVSALAGGLALTIGLGAFFNPSPSANASSPLSRAEAAATAAPPTVPGSLPAAGPSMAFPGIDGVDLLALGYQGVDLDAVTVADLDLPLPELPTERATELRARIVVATAHVEGLRAAEYVLYETARALRVDVRAAGAELEQVAQADAEATERRDEIRAEVAHRRALLAAQPALDTGTGATDGSLNAAELDALAARRAAEEAELRLLDLEARRQDHRAALDLAHRSANRMDAHIEYLHNELRHARSGMLAAGRWLAEEERGRQDLPLVRVEGFRVHASIAGSLRDMVVAARADGIDLRGKAYRSTQRQIELRRQNCGPTEFDIHEKSSSACSPPTAKPNRSLHESGLAVDFRHGEESITSRRSPAYQWLAANAAGYGFFNLASEPWHWSVSAA